MSICYFSFTLHMEIKSWQQKISMNWKSTKSIMTFLITFTTKGTSPAKRTQLHNFSGKHPSCKLYWWFAACLNQNTEKPYFIPLVREFPDFCTHCLSLFITIVKKVKSPLNSACFLLHGNVVIIFIETVQNWFARIIFLYSKIAYSLPLRKPLKGPSYL